jgi:6,7-dimethyl-8-ribityllumazine synthase
MTSSDDTALSPGALEDAASLVGAAYDGEGHAPGARVAVVCAKFNGGITERLLRGALAGFDAHGVPAEAVSLAWVPGAFELPLAARRLAESGQVDAVVTLGAVIRGDTAHFDFVAGECASGLQRAALDTGVPVIFGVLTTDTVEQALVRSGEGVDNKGYEAARSALEMADLLGKLPKAAG